MAKRQIIARIIGTGGLQGKQLRGKVTYAQGVKPIGIGVQRELSLGIGKYKALTFCHTVAVCSRFITCPISHTV